MKAGYRQEAEALLSSNRKDEGTELVLFCASRIYIFPNVSDRIYFLSLAGVYALQRQDPLLLRYVLHNLLRLFNRGASGPLLRLIAKGGGANAIARQARLVGFLRLELQLLDAHRALFASLWGKIAVKGFQFCLSALRQARSTEGESQKHLLLSRASGVSPAPGTQHDARPILVTRAMGGIGDILMMTPGLAALKRQNPKREIHFAVARHLQSILNGFPSVTAVAIDEGIFYQEDYSAWYNLTECPAARIESLTLPYVRTNRIDAYAAAMGLAPKSIAAEEKIPHYYVTEEEHAAARQFLADHNSCKRIIVGVHLFAADSYKNYDKTTDLVQALGQKYSVLLFHDQSIQGYDFPNVVKVDRCTLRESFALLAECAVCIGPDSSFLHTSAALSVPFVALFGPTSGKVFTCYYPKVTVISSEGCCAREPCWKNQLEACLLSGCSQSQCLQRINQEYVVRVTEGILSKISLLS